MLETSTPSSSLVRKNERERRRTFYNKRVLYSNPYFSHYRFNLYGEDDAEKVRPPLTI